MRLLLIALLTTLTTSSLASAQDRPAAQRALAEALRGGKASTSAAATPANTIPLPFGSEAELTRALAAFGIRLERQNDGKLVATDSTGSAIVSLEEHDGRPALALLSGNETVRGRIQKAILVERRRVGPRGER